MRILDECKTAIRQLSAEDRARLMLWLSHGMPADEERPVDSAPNQQSQYDPERLREQERRAIEGFMQHMKNFHFTEDQRQQIKLNEPPLPAKKGKRK
jgi:hypothetical protein